MVEPRRSHRRERKAGAGDSVLRADLSSFPWEWEEGRRHLSEYAEAILDAASDHGLSEVEILRGSFTSKVAESGYRAHAVLLGKIQAQRTSAVWWLFPDARWTEVGGGTTLQTWAHPDGRLPGDICAWGPKAASVLEAIEAAWAQLNRGP